MTVTRAERRRAARIARAEETRRRALSPVRILMRIVGLPLVAAALAVSIYVRTSPFGRQDALRHLVALAGCDAAEAVGVAPAAEGMPGYHPRNDPDGDGIACGRSATMAPAMAAPSPEAPVERMPGGAKFVRP